MVRMIRLIDTHSHLEEIQDLNVSIERAENAGVSAIIAVGMDYESNQRTLEFSGTYGGITVYPALGIHPWNLDISKLELNIHLIEEHIQKVVAIGEIGLDYWLKETRKDLSKRALQKKVFKTLLGLSKHHKKPAIIHCRGAWEDALHLVCQAEIKKAVFHWYSGPIEILDKIMAYGYYMSATPAAAYSKSHQRAINKAPLGSLLLETDSPVVYEGERSEPSHVLKTLDAVSRIKGVSKEQVAMTTTENAIDFFNLG